MGKQENKAAPSSPQEAGQITEASTLNPPVENLTLELQTARADVQAAITARDEAITAKDAAEAEKTQLQARITDLETQLGAVSKALEGFAAQGADVATAVRDAVFLATTRADTIQSLEAQLEQLTAPVVTAEATPPAEMSEADLEPNEAGLVPLVSKSAASGYNQEEIFGVQPGVAEGLIRAGLAVRYRE